MSGEGTNEGSPTTVIANRLPKLVRDRIPDVLARRGLFARTPIATPDEGPALLRAKLDEEVAELQSSNGDEAALDELADVLEVVRALAALHGASAAALEERRAAKAAARGGFDAGIVLLGVDTPPPDEGRRP